MAGYMQDGRLGYASDFLCSARRYWLSVFPRVSFELRRLRLLADRIPDQELRALAIQALEHKRGNVEGAAAFAALVPGKLRPIVTRALVSCQVICDYLDLVSEQPSSDPVANGYRLHEALIVATAPGEPHRNYYSAHTHREDGGYLQTLVSSLRNALVRLPSLDKVAGALGRAAERVAVYQSFNHGDAGGSFEPFDRWSAHTAHHDLRPWESAAGAGSTLSTLALIAAAADPRLSAAASDEIENAYFPWIGSLHSLLDSLVDYDEDLALEGRALIAYYPTPLEAAERMAALASESLRRAQDLPEGKRHALIVAAMTSFYLCEIDRGESSEHAQVIAPAVLKVFGPLARPNLAVLEARRSLRSRSLPSAGSRRLPSVAGMR